MSLDAITLAVLKSSPFITSQAPFYTTYLPNPSITNEYINYKNYVNEILFLKEYFGFKCFLTVIATLQKGALLAVYQAP